MITFLAALVLAPQSGCSEWTPGFEVPGVDIADWGSPLGVGASAVFDDGLGPALYAGGAFTSAGGVAANRIAKWDDSSWAPVGQRDKLWYRGTGLSALYAGGNFTNAVVSGDNHLAKWGCATPSATNYCTARTSASGCQALLSAVGTASATAPSGFTLSAATVEG